MSSRFAAPRLHPGLHAAHIGATALAPAATTADHDHLTRSLSGPTSQKTTAVLPATSALRLKFRPTARV